MRLRSSGFASPRAALVLACLLGLAGGATAGDPTRSGLAAPRSGSALHGQLELSLADAIAMGLENNLGVEIQRHAPLIATEDRRAAWGAYDPELFADFGYADVDTPTGNVLLGTAVATSEVIDGAGGFRGLVPWLGAFYEVSLTGSDTRTNSSIQVLSPELRSDVTFALTVPLLRDLIWSQPWTNVKTTRVLEDTALQQFRQVVMDTVQQIEIAYWTLIADDERVRVAEKSRETAAALLEQVNTQYEVGVVSKVEIAEAEAGVAAREFELIRAQNAYQNTMDGLIDLVLGAGLTADSRIQIEPTDRPDEYVAYDIDVSQAAEIAFRHRPELVVADKTIERQELNLKLAKNQRLPALDAQVSYGNRGIAGFQSPDFNPCRFSPDPMCDPDTVPDQSIGGYPDTFETPGDFFGRNAAEAFTARALLSIPIPNTSGRARVSKAELELRRAYVARKRVEQDIVLGVREAARNLKSSQEGIAAADRQRAAAEEQLRAERIRLEYGESTPFQVLQREEDLVSAEQGYIGAFQIYRTSVTGLDRAQGTILRNRNISIDDVSRLR